jgi:hypothetical protein
LGSQRRSNPPAAELKAVRHQHKLLFSGEEAVISESKMLRDVHKIKQLLDDVDSLDAFKTAFPLLKPVLATLGVDTSSIEEAFEQFDAIAQEVRDIASVPDRFNDLFASRGWIMFERMDMEIAKKALQQAESGDNDAAEETLVEYFDPDFVEREMKTLIPLESFRPRMDLARKALDDYRAGRYHASIPVVLAQIDGFVSELHQRQRGFFAEEADMEAWDSLAAHSKGLNQLSSIFRKGRRRTTTDPISVPYRHGIMHGRDLGYGNRTVAAKTWAALFAVREWAIRVERDELDPPPEEPPEGLGEILTSLVETRRETERWRNWTARQVDWSELGPSPTPDRFDDSTPEKALADFLRWWSQDNYGYMTHFVPHLFSKFADEPLPLQIRREYESHELEVFFFRELDHSVPATAEITVELRLKSDGSTRERTVTFRLICEDANGDTVAPGNPNAKWVVMNWNALNLLS